MSGSLSHIWEYLSIEIWEPLAAYSGRDVAAPPDLFSDLFIIADEFLSPGPTEMELAEARNDPDKARIHFLALRGTDFTNESAIVHFLEEVHNIIVDYEIPGFEDLYRRLLNNAICKFNLRYRLDDPFILRFLLPGSFTNLYAEIQRVNAGSDHLEGLLTDFEKAFDHFARTQDRADLKTCIAKASNYIEGLASATYGEPSTLGRLCDRLTDWPHDNMRDAIKNLYWFCSDYPGIRHGGDPRGVRRDLDSRDMTLATFLLLTSSVYLSHGMDERAILGI
ncbi:MAG: hypothetical protein A4E45_01049 [Methanosaeta sp. PtaB.Bin039]|nr:MAG: hypothetical protein A4E45_01049 [Methanosaeta sp. PtaB.Bin039]